MNFFQKVFCSKLINENRELKRKLGVDFLTGLKNRFSYRGYIEGLFKKLSNKNNDIHYVFVDLDSFKEINDLKGHSVGDKVLKDVASILKDNLRSGDRVFRLAGDEFVIFFNRISKKDIKKRLISLQDKIVEKYPRGIKGGVSFGVYKIDFKNDTTQTVLDKADHLMYKSKHQGGNKIIFWDEVKKENE